MAAGPKVTLPNSTRGKARQWHRPGQSSIVRGASRTANPGAGSQ